MTLAEVLEELSSCRAILGLCGQRVILDAELASLYGVTTKPYVFTEHGAIMAATLLNSPRAVEMSIYIARAFVQLRELLASNKTVPLHLNRPPSTSGPARASSDRSIPH